MLIRTRAPSQGAAPQAARKSPSEETRQPCLPSPPAPKCEWVRAVNRGGSAGLQAHQPDSIPTTRPAGFMYNTFTTNDRNHLKGNMKTL